MVGTGQLDGDRFDRQQRPRQYALGGTLTWEIDVWGNIRRQIESDSAAAQASYATLAAARLSAQSSLVTNYYSLRISDERKRLLEASVAAYARAMEIVGNQMNAGTVSQLNLAQAQALYEQTRAQLVAEAANRAQFEHAIAALIGKAPAEFSLPPARISDTVPTVEAGVPSALLERRPDIASAERSMAAANAQIGVAVGAYYPQFTLNASINFVSTMLSTLLQIANAVWAVGPQLAGTLVDGGSRAAQVEGARANFDKTVATYRQTVITAFQQVEDALAQQRVFEEQERVQRIAVAASRNAERIALNQYSAGTVDYTTVVTITDHRAAERADPAQHPAGTLHRELEPDCGGGRRLARQRHAATCADRRIGNQQGTQEEELVAVLTLVTWAARARGFPARARAVARHAYRFRRSLPAGVAGGA